MTESSELWAAVEASYDSVTIDQLTNVNANNASAENDTIGLDAAAEAIALWDVYAQVDYDSTDATHVAVGKYAVIAILRARGGTIEGVAQAAWENVFGPEGMIARVKNTGPRGHAAPLSSSDRKRQSELSSGSKRKQGSDPSRVTDNLPRGGRSE